jgi:sugar diacid utilization regulator
MFLCTHTVTGMAVTFRDLCAEGSLGIKFRGEAAWLDREIRWVTVTELEDPTPWLSGGELVLTTRLWRKSARTQTQFVRSLAAAGAAGFGFAAPTQQQLPQAALRAALELELPAIEAPYDSPFIAISRSVAERLFEEQYAQRRRLMDAHDTLAQALLSGEGLNSLIRALHALTGAPASIIDLHGRVLSSRPRRHDWPAVDALVTLERQERSSGRGNDPSVRLIEIEGSPVAFLCSEATGAAVDLLPYAERLVGLELSKEQAVLRERRQLAGQVIHDVIHRVISDEEAERRLSVFGIQLSATRTVVLATADCDPKRLRSSPWVIYPLAGGTTEPALTALVGRYAVALVPQHQPAIDIAHQMADNLSALAKGVRVGIGGMYGGADGLRWSYLEAKDALTRGPGVHERAPLDLPRLLLSSPELPFRQLAVETLLPLIQSDAQSGTQLIETLRTFFSCDESINLTAGKLFLHRNTVHYRLRQIEQLTGRRLSSTHDRLQLWLAILAMDLLAAGRQEPPT